MFGGSREEGVGFGRGGSGADLDSAIRGANHIYI